MVKDLRRPVVVAVGGPGSGRAAIQLAATEAGYRQAPLIAVTAYHSASPVGAPAARPVASSMHAPGEEHTTAEAMLGDEVAAALGDQAVQAELRAVAGLPGRKLVETARATNAQMIVLASGLSGSELAGAVSQYVLRNAPCPVLVVPDRP
ncbi:MAG TPA: universal stress protein [Streptosporangiaceae bacterium]|nr:universal stress protein [Streptosporangiaceae bacterium]